MNTAESRRREWIDLLPVLALFVVAALLRIFRLDETPGIYPDETSHLEVAYSLLRGDFSAGLFTSTFLPRLPLPLMLINLSAATVGWNLYAVRIWTVVAALLGFVVMARLLRTAPSARLLTLVVLSIYPPAIYFSRWGFTYGFLALAFLYVVYQGIEYSTSSQTSDLHKLALGIAAALLIEPLGIVALLYGLVICAFRGWRPSWTVLWISVLPVSTYLALLIGLVPEILSSDIHGILQTRNLTATSHIPVVFASLQSLFQVFGWPFLLGLVGLGFAPRIVRRHSIIFVAIYFLVAAQVAGEDRTLVVRQFIAVIPILCLGIGCSLASVEAIAEKWLRRLVEKWVLLGAHRWPSWPMI
jgi:hypothetical protein